MRKRDHLRLVDAVPAPEVRSQAPEPRCFGDYRDFLYRGGRRPPLVQRTRPKAGEHVLTGTGFVTMEQIDE